MTPLLEGDRYAWIAPRRVSGGGVAKLDDHYLDRDHPTPGFVADAPEELLEGGLPALADPDPIAEALQRVVLTARRRLLYTRLCRQQQRALRNPQISGAAHPAALDLRRGSSRVSRHQGRES